MKFLLKHIYSVITGVLSTLDIDYDAVCMLGIPVVSEAPFFPITEENRKANLAMIDRASAMVVSNVPFGYGNLKNLEATKVALERRKLTVIVETAPVNQIDFTDGKAQSLFEELKSKGAITVEGRKEALSILKALGNSA